MLGKHIHHCEDSLTASVFTHLLHLPSEVAWKLLWNACNAASLPKLVGEFQKVEFWPSWKPHGTDNTVRVVPDLFIRFAEFDLIVEAKRWEDGGQSEGQWKKELTAYANEYADESKKVGLLALGGIHQGLPSEVCCEWSPSLPDTSEGLNRRMRVIECSVHLCRWRDILNQCKWMRAQIESLDYASSYTLATHRTLHHIIDLFSWHGISTGTWFIESMDNLPEFCPSLPAHLGLFQQIAATYS